MTNAMISAKIISDQIIGKENPYSEIYSPQRKQFKNSIRLGATHALDSAINLTAGLFSTPKYTCSHMGCRLSKNKEENSLDCPCHGSRFSLDGNVIENPAISNIPSKNQSTHKKS